MRTFVFAWLLLFTGCVTKTDVAWRRIDMGPFSFFAPEDLKRERGQGIDSYFGSFTRRGLKLSFDYGSFSGFGGTEYRPIIVDRKPARMGAGAQDSGRPFPYFAHIVFRDVQPDIHLSMFASCATTEDSVLAQRIFRSIEFK